MIAASDSYDTGIWSAQYTAAVAQTALAIHGRRPWGLQHRRGDTGASLGRYQRTSGHVAYSPGRCGDIPQPRPPSRQH